VDINLYFKNLELLKSKSWVNNKDFKSYYENVFTYSNTINHNYVYDNPVMTEMDYRVLNQEENARLDELKKLKKFKVVKRDIKNYEAGYNSKKSKIDKNYKMEQLKLLQKEMKKKNINI